MRKFLVVMDKSDEWETALNYAAIRAQKTGGGVEVLAVIEPEEFQHWIGVGERMKAEAREKIKEDFRIYQERIQMQNGLDMELVVREGVLLEQVLQQITEDVEIGVLVLAAGNTKDGPGPLINSLVGRHSHKMRVPITIVPGRMTIDAIQIVS